MVRNNYLIYLLAFLYALTFVYVIPWVDLNGGEFKDIPNYLGRIVYLEAGGTEAEFWGFSWLISEPLWKQIIIFLGYAFDDYRAALYGISVFVVFIYSSFVLKRVEFYIGMIFLITPMTVNLFIEQIRIAVAFSLVLIAYDIKDHPTVRKYYVPAILLLSAFFIHSAMLAFYSIYFVLHTLNKKVEDKKYYLIAIVSALFIALFMKYGANVLLMIVGDRRANYGDIIESSSLAFSISWFIIALILATFAEFTEKSSRVMVAYAITIMSFFFFSSILDMFAARYVAVIMPLIIISISYLPKHFKQGTYIFFFAYNIFAFKYWLKLTIL